MTLLGSTTITEHAFSIMKVLKQACATKWKISLLWDNLVVCIEKEIAKNYMRFNDFSSLEECRIQFWLKMFNFYIIVWFQTYLVTRWLLIKYKLKDIKFQSMLSMII